LLLDISAAVSSSLPAVGAAAARSTELLGIPGEGTGKGQTCMGRATSMVNEQLSLAALSDHVSFFSRIALAHHAYQAEFSWASQ